MRPARLTPAVHRLVALDQHHRPPIGRLSEAQVRTLTQVAALKQCLQRLPPPDQYRAGVYLAGDALGFVDPFTGSGILAALLTGRLAGEAASRGLAFEDYYAQCRRMLRRQYRVASALRGMLGSGLTANLARWIPGSLLYRLTRPRV